MKHYLITTAHIIFLRFHVQVPKLRPTKYFFSEVHFLAFSVKYVTFCYALSVITIEAPSDTVFKPVETYGVSFRLQ